MVEGVQGGGDLTPQDRVLYRQEFERAVNLFQQSLTAYQQSEIPAQKEEFKKVMAKTLEVIHQTIRQVILERPEQKDKELSSDYQQFLDSDNSKNIAKLGRDLDDLKRAS
jgi:hypothetical protein